MGHLAITTNTSEHQYGIGSLAEPCKACGTAYAVAAILRTPCRLRTRHEQHLLDQMYAALFPQWDWFGDVRTS